MAIKTLDETNKKIIELLQKDGRMTYSEIGKMLNISRTAVQKRVTEMEEKGIICGYTAVIKQEKIADFKTFILNIEVHPAHYKKLREILEKAPETSTVVLLTGKGHLMAICSLKDVEEASAFGIRIQEQCTGIITMSTQVVLDVIKGNILPEKQF